MNAEILSQLRDIHWPPSPSFWPPAIGYYLAGILSLGVSLAAFLLLRRMWRRRQIKQEIISELNTIESHFLAHQDVGHLQGELVALCRRLLLSKQPVKINKAADFEEIARALITLMPRPQHTKNLLELLQKDRFHKHPNVDGYVLLNLAREQIKRCRI